MNDVLYIGGNFIVTLQEIYYSSFALFNMTNESWLPADSIEGGDLLVLSMTIVNDTICVGGSFSNAGSLITNGIACAYANGTFYDNAQGLPTGILLIIK
jgi:hypothetical protein